MIVDPRGACWIAWLTVITTCHLALKLPRGLLNTAPPGGAYAKATPVPSTSAHSVATNTVRGREVRALEDPAGISRSLLRQRGRVTSSGSRVTPVTSFTQSTQHTLGRACAAFAEFTAKKRPLPPKRHLGASVRGPYRSGVQLRVTVSHSLRWSELSTNASSDPPPHATVSAPSSPYRVSLPDHPRPGRCPRHRGSRRCWPRRRACRCRHRPRACRHPCRCAASRHRPRRGRCSCPARR